MKLASQLIDLLTMLSPFLFSLLSYPHYFLFFSTQQASKFGYI